jgi:hypothetical protein
MEAKQMDGITALIAAADNGHDKCVELLLNAGCDVNALTNQSISALLVAVENAHIDRVRTLVRCGADVTIQWQGKLLDEMADDTSIADELKAALRVPAEKRRRCEHCGTTTSNAMYKCGVCKSTDKTTYYCNDDCQKADWERHKSVCKAVDDVE